MEKPTFRASALDRIINCPGSVSLISKQVANTHDIGGVDGDEMTWRGNWAHHAAAEILVKDFGAVGAPKRPAIPEGFAPDDRDMAMVGWYISQVTIGTPIDHQIYVENRITMEFDRFVLTGELDNYSISPDGAAFTIDDLKTGMYEVDHAESNWQLLAYTVLLKHLHPSIKRGKIRIHQKYAENQTTEADIDQTDGLAAYLEGIINTAIDNRLELNSGHKQCRLCPAVMFPCPAIVQEIDAMKYLLTEEELEKLPVTPDLKELAVVCARGRAIRGPIDKLINRLKSRMEADSIPAVTLPDGMTVSIEECNGPSSILHTKAAFIVVADKIGEERAWDTLSISLGKIEEQLIKAEVVKFKDSKKDPANSAAGWAKHAMPHLINRTRVKQLTFSNPK